VPYLTVYTNVKPDDAKALAEKTSHLTAEILHKPEAYVATNIVYNQAMAFGGSAAQAGVLAELRSIGLGDKDRFVAELTSLLAKELHISQTNYINISLADMPAMAIASGGRTFG